MLNLFCNNLLYFSSILVLKHRFMFRKIEKVQKKMFRKQNILSENSFSQYLICFISKNMTFAWSKVITWTSRINHSNESIWSEAAEICKINILKSSLSYTIHKTLTTSLGFKHNFLKCSYNLELYYVMFS